MKEIPYHFPHLFNQVLVWKKLHTPQENESNLFCRDQSTLELQHLLPTSPPLSVVLLLCCLLWITSHNSKSGNSKTQSA